ncbi:hypothetical protein HBH70_238770 [Parastagonospora nodorum]|nr:hypothetical protein HBI10_021180 [Parastagonospora nodorum]KAH4059765.1 hypothetical protein HBH49_022830 [Parastagonospora nodorum]KAH4151472.1 hypothetical protein HBH43_241290 [Parastagonospora nodorum]KAH4173534.1 hypothetical protein HBH44_021820 [Parastagonospora nodorum]KAH4399972.1 hypothetical protein HBH92_241310 [Parastagonospora nodorum]
MQRDHNFSVTTSQYHLQFIKWDLLEGKRRRGAITNGRVESHLTQKTTSAHSEASAQMPASLGPALPQIHPTDPAIFPPSPGRDDRGD